MRTSLKFIVFFSLIIISVGQEIQHEAVAINIEVPVRVYKNDVFIDSLTIDDFEVFEDGILQRVEAVYLIKKTDIDRKEERKVFAPETGRHFYLFFEITQYTPRIGEAVDYFFSNVITEDDNCTVVTPLKTYNMKGESFLKVSKDEVVAQLKSILRKEAWMGSAEYRSAVSDFTQIARELSGGDVLGGEFIDVSGRPITLEMEFDEKLMYCETVLEKMEALRRIDEAKILEFAEYMKNKEGQKYVFMFYQREFIPTLEQRVLDNIMFRFQSEPHIPLKVSQLFQLYHRDSHIDVDKVKKAYADSSIAVHFLFFTKMADRTPGVQMIERSEDVFSAFNEMALASGGLTQSSANPQFLFKNASDASENYYLIYYTPKDYKADGAFKNIKVNVIGDRYRVTHRIGYFAK